MPVYPTKLESESSNTIFVRISSYRISVMNKRALAPTESKESGYDVTFPAPDNQIGIADQHSWEDLKSGMAGGLLGFAGNRIAQGAWDAAGDIGKYYKSSGGEYRNDMSALMYLGPANKTLELSWTFVPENAGEAGKLKEIINKLRAHSYPDGSPTEPNQTYPFYFKIDVHYGAKRLTSYIDCVIESLTVNYSGGPDGAMAMFKDGYPLVTNLTIGFKQIFKNTAQSINQYVNFQ